MKAGYDFSGYATRNDLKCTDGRIIKRDAFKNNDGAKVPLVFNHQHNSPYNILGHCMLENREDGVYTYGYFNDTEEGLRAKKQVVHGDLTSLSILANGLKQNGPEVVHGTIREVSLVLAGANPGAVIDTIIEHGDDGDEEAVITINEEISISHADGAGEKKPDPPAKPEAPKGDETLQDVFDTLDEKQKTAVYALLAMAMEEDTGDVGDTGDKEGEGKDMKHNLFDGQSKETKESILSHSDQAAIITSAKSTSVGSFRAAVEIYLKNNKELAHGVDLGIDDVHLLFPEYKDVRPGAPEMLTTDQGWIGRVLAKVHKSPISRIRTRQADVRNITALRAKGYEKGGLKTPIGNINLVSRTTDPQTIYVKSKLDRDDVVDIVDFDVVQYMYGINRMNLNEELAMAIMLGDGREDGEDGKISADHIRPIWLDDELYTMHADVDMEAMRTELQGTETASYFGDNYVYAEAIIQTLLYTREQYKGSGSPDFYCTPHLLNVMLLARDRDGRRIYGNVTELRAALNVGEIITAEQFAGKTRVTAGNKTKRLLGIMVNLADYSLGQTRGGEITHFTDFDIDFNQEKSLLETRVSGANTRVLSAIALEEDVTA